MVDSAKARLVATQIEQMYAAVECPSPLVSLLSASETDGLRTLLLCAKECGADWVEGRENRVNSAKLMQIHRDYSDRLLAAALADDWGGGIADLRGVLLNRLFNCSHPFLVECERRPPNDIPQALHQSMRRFMQYAEALAGPDWGFYLQPIGAAESISREYIAGEGAEPEAIVELKECFYHGSDWPQFVESLGRLVHEYGRGELRRFAAFRVVAKAGKSALMPIRHFAGFPLEWLEGNEARMRTIEDNTRNFLAGHKAHNVLVWGPRGGGKSTLIRALIGKYFDRGLRAIEITPTIYDQLPHIFALVRGHRHRFIGVLDNISLDRGDGSLHLLSRVLDGGLEEWPDNLVFYATSNYKDLVDREGERPLGLGQMQMDEQNPNLINQSIRPEFYDPQQLQRLDEERALDDRFALKVFLDLPHKTQYQKMILSYARRAGIDLVEEDLLAAFEIWRMRHNHDLVGGRTVRDFILAQLPEYLRQEED